MRFTSLLLLTVLILTLPARAADPAADGKVISVSPARLVAISDNQIVNINLVVQAQYFRPNDPAANAHGRMDIHFINGSVMSLELTAAEWTRVQKALLDLGQIIAQIIGWL